MRRERAADGAFVDCDGVEARFLRGVQYTERARRYKRELQRLPE